MKLKTALMAALVLLVLSALAEPSITRLYSRDGLTNFSLQTGVACTTRWINCQRYRFQTLSWQQWVTPGCADSARVEWDFQIAARDTSNPDSELDTLRLLAVGRPDDTTGVARTFIVPAFPEQCVFVRYIVTGKAGTSDSTYVGNVDLLTDDLK